MFADLERIAAVLGALPEKKLAIAYSGGVDSVTLARSAEIILGKKMYCFYLQIPFLPPARKKLLLWNGRRHGSLNV